MEIGASADAAGRFLSGAQGSLGGNWILLDGGKGLGGACV